MIPFLLLESGAADAAFNMALDEALLEAMPRLGKPALRFYSWTQRAASFGYFQKYREIESMTLLRPLVRRPTGGGVVPHDSDWTYSLAFPTQHEWHSLRAIESYSRVHEWIQSAFTKLGVATELAAESRKAEAGQCFVGHERFDVLLHRRKLAGAAQRRNLHGLLIQGSIQPQVGLCVSRANWQNAMREASPPGGRVEWVSFEPDELLKRRTEQLAQQKYSQTGYNEKR